PTVASASTAATTIAPESTPVYSAKQPHGIHGCCPESVRRCGRDHLAVDDHLEAAHCILPEPGRGGVPGGPLPHLPATDHRPPAGGVGDLELADAARLQAGDGHIHLRAPGLVPVAHRQVRAGHRAAAAGLLPG